MKAHLRQCRISVQKANVIAGLIRGQNAEQALNLLKFTPKKAAKIFYKTLSSAVANAQENNGVDPSTLTVKSVVVNKGPFYKRHLPSTRGRALRINKPTAHITIELS